MFAEHGSLKSLLVKEGQEITIHPVRFLIWNANLLKISAGDNSSNTQ